MWYRIELQIGHVGDHVHSHRDSSGNLLPTSHTFFKEGDDPDDQALKEYEKLEAQAEDDRKERRLVTKPKKLVRIDILEKVTDLTPSLVSPFLGYDDAG